MSVTAIVPIKFWHAAKSQLDIDNRLLKRLAEAFATDVLSCLIELPPVDRTLVMTADRPVAELAVELGAIPFSPRNSIPLDQLNRAVDQGSAWVVEHHPNDGSSSSRPTCPP